MPEGVLACFHPVNACFMPVACVKNRLMMILLIGVFACVCVCVSEVGMPLKYIMFFHYSLLTFSDLPYGSGAKYGNKRKLGLRLHITKRYANPKIRTLHRVN